MSSGKRRTHNVLKEFHRHIDTTIGNTVVQRISRSQALKAVLLGVIRNHPMHGDGTVVVYPEDVLTVEIEAQRGHEATRRRDAFFRANVRQFSVTDTGDGIITPCQAQKDPGCAAKSPIGIEYEGFGVNLVYNHERHAAIVA
ncbi:MAG: hypothetical protein ACLPN1_18855 [Dissulfurispiraceae bacterium]